MRRTRRLLLSLSGACALAMGLAVGCQPGEVGETDAGATGAAGTTGGGSTSGQRRDVGQRRRRRQRRPATPARRATPARTAAPARARARRAAADGGTSGTAGRGGTTGTAAPAAAPAAAARPAPRAPAARRQRQAAAGRPAPRARAARPGRGGTTGTAGTGGTTGAAGASGTTGSGGSPPTQCTLQNHSGNGSFTWYYFGQGTARDGNGYRTACGYYGTENGQTDTIENIASMSPASATYFAAIPGQNGFDSKSHCGECVQITGQNGTIDHRDRHRRVPLRQRRRQQRVRRQRRRPPRSQQGGVRSPRLSGRQPERHQLEVRPLPGQRQRQGPFQIWEQQRILRRERDHADRVGQRERNERVAAVVRRVARRVGASRRPRR